jgi:hypothetical protein
MNRLLSSLPRGGPGWLAPLALVPVVPLALVPAPAAAQSAEDWRSAPYAIPPPAPEAAPGARSAPEPPPPRQILQPPPELFRPQGALGGASDVRIVPGAGVRPRSRPLPPPAAAPALPGRVPALPARVPATVVIPRPVPVPATVAPLPPSPPPRRVSPRQPFPSVLESLPPGTIRPLPGEILPGSPASPPASAVPPQAVPPQAVPPQAVPPTVPPAVPPPPWAAREGRGAGATGAGQEPWRWLLLGLGLGGGAMFLLQRPRRPRAEEPPMQNLDIRIEPRPDPGVQTLSPAGLRAESPGPGGRA